MDLPPSLTVNNPDLLHVSPWHHDVIKTGGRRSEANVHTSVEIGERMRGMSTISGFHPSSEGDVLLADFEINKYGVQAVDDKQLDQVHKRFERRVLLLVLYCSLCTFLFLLEGEGRR